MSSKRDWTEGLPELFEGYTESEPAGLWSAVRAGVGAGWRRVAAWWYAGGALLAAAAVVALVVPFRPAADPSVIQVTPGDVVAQEGVGAETVSPAEEAAQLAPASQDGSPSFHPSGTPDPSQQSWAPPVTATGGYGSKRDSVLPDDLTSSSATVETAAETIADTREVESVSGGAKTGEQTPEIPESVSGDAKTGVQTPEGSDSWKQTTVQLERRTRQRTRIKIQAGVYGGALMAQNVSQSGQQAAHVASMMGSAPAIQTKSMSGGATTFNPSIINRNKPSTTESNHRQSARFGAGIKVNFLPRWGVETGIVGTTLNSSWETTTGNSVQTIEQEMHYLGIPLFVHFNALEWRGLSLYLAAGPMYEFTNETSETWSTKLNGKLVSSAADQSLQKDSRWSANIAAGLQLEFMENNAIYIQPGFSYHFPHRNVDGLDLQNYYTAKPAAFNLTIGYRLLLF